MNPRQNHRREATGKGVAERIEACRKRLRTTRAVHRGVVEGREVTPEASVEARLRPVEKGRGVDAAELSDDVEAYLLLA